MRTEPLSEVERTTRYRERKKTGAVHVRLDVPLHLQATLKVLAPDYASALVRAAELVHNARLKAKQRKK